MSQFLRAARSALVAAALISAIARPCAAQDTGVIEGTVTDAQGAVLPGAAVTLKNTETGVARDLVTDAEGKYRFPALGPGTYSLTTSLQAFATAEIRDIVLTIGLDAR